MFSQPAIVIATGSFCLPEWYTVVMEPLVAEGYQISAPQLPTVGKKPGPPPTLYDDAAAIAKAVEKFTDQGKDVVLFGHSYGGTVISQAAKGLSKSERERHGKKGGIVRLAFMTALVPDLGGATTTANDPAATGSYISLDEEGWMHHNNPAETAKYVFNHQTPENGLALAKRFPEHSAVSFTNEMTYAGYKDIPSSWLFAEDDLCIPPEYQQKAIDRIEAASGIKVDVTRGDFDHCPQMEKPEETLQWIVSVVEKSTIEK